MPTPLEYAAEYAPRLGWKIFPTTWPENGGCSCFRKASCDSPGKHPLFRGWQQEATSERERILAWARRFPRANVGVATGAPSGIVVLDVDPRHGGSEALEELQARHGPLPETVEVLTGGGGRHLYFQHPGVSVPNKAGIAPGVDIRGDGGFVVGPGSLHASGGRYDFEVSHGPEDVPLAPLPPWLLEALHRGGGASSNGKAHRSPMAALAKGPVPIGQRNNAMASLAGYLLHHLPDPHVAEELLLAWVEARWVREADPREWEANVAAARRTIESIAQSELKKLQRKKQDLAKLQKKP